MRRLTTLVVAALVIVGLAGCAPTSSSDAASQAQSEPLIVFAAASLQSSFDELAEAFEAAHPEYPVGDIRYDGSQALAAQLVDGADVDVIAFANESSIAPLIDAGVADDSTIFATNTLRIAVAPGNPKAVTELSDLASDELTVVLCAPEVPCGAASQMLLEDAGVDVTAASEETNVTSVVRRISDGEADAGLVYATDVQAADGALEGITPDNVDVAVNRYPLAVATSAPSADAAAAFAAFVLSDAGQAILADHGFGAP